MIMSNFAHLSLHTEYSVIDSVVRINDLVHHAKNRGLDAIAVTDHRNLYAALKTQSLCLQYGIKPIIGIDMQVTVDNYYDRVILLAKNSIGLENLRALVARAYRNVEDHGILKNEWFNELNEGLIFLSGGVHGPIGRLLLNENIERAHSLARWYREIFSDRFYLEVARVGHASEVQYINRVLELSDKEQIPVVATNDVRFLKEADFDIHETRYCIQHK